jgi:uncharacterized iron-regulated membrane protein
VKPLRSILFWCHLVAGAIGGVVILIMSGTGAVLALKPQIVAAVDRELRVVSPEDAAPLAPSALIAAARGRKPGVALTTMTAERDPSAAVAIAFGPSGTVYVNPYTGAVLGEASASVQTFFRTMENWHRWLGAGTERRAAARAITGACNLAFLGLALSGLFLWWPHKWSPQHTRAILVFRRGARGRARDFNWHNVIGFWCAPAIVIMTVSGAVISYPWASALVYRLTGSPVPAAAGRVAQIQPPGQRQAAEASSASDFDRLWARAEQQLPTWRIITMRIPDRVGMPVSFTMSDSREWNAFARSTLALDPRTAGIVHWQPYTANSLGQQARGWLRFAHTGELGGLTGQTIAGAACVGGAVLVWTGLSLALRRVRAWSTGRRVVPATL